MSNRGKTLLKGHALQQEGHPTAWDSIYGWWRFDPTWGRGHCECGAAAPLGISVKAVQRWHREHKDALREAL